MTTQYRDIDSRHTNVWSTGDWCVAFYTDAPVPLALRESLEHLLTADYDLVISPWSSGHEIILWHNGPVAEALVFSQEVVEDAVLDYCLRNESPLGFKIVDITVMSLAAWRALLAVDSDCCT